MTATAQDTDRDAARPATGIAIDPVRLTRLRDMVPLSRAGLAERTGEILFDYNWFAKVMAGRAPATARLARALWLVLDCDPAGVIDAIPRGLDRVTAYRWARENDWWRLRLDSVKRLRDKQSVLDGDKLRKWTDADLAGAVARYWFSRDAVNKIENTNPRIQRYPKPETLAAFCEILDCEPADLMGGGPIPPGLTEAHRKLLGYNARMRAFADARGTPESYRMWNNRIRYTSELREAYEAYLASQGDEALAS